MKKLISVYLLCITTLLALTSCDKEYSIEGASFEYTDPSKLSDDQKDEYFSKFVVGTWVNESSAKYYFLSNNEGYFLSNVDFGGISFDAFEWSFEKGTLIMNFFENPKYGRKRKNFPFSVVSNDSIEIFGDKYTRLDYNGSTTYNYHKPPFECYFYIAGNGCYYPMKMVGRKCTHADGYGSSNFKDLRFYGSNGDVEPFGAVITYATPYYEGINSEWPAGYYSLASSSGYWKYTGYFNYLYNHESIRDGWLEIKVVGSLIEYDFSFNDSEIIGHFIGQEQ